nr:mediator of RNA polymerase II transcription subunit 19A-like isoform X1 [Ipomoea batatas]
MPARAYLFRHAGKGMCDMAKADQTRQDATDPYPRDTSAYPASAELIVSSPEGTKEFCRYFADHVEGVEGLSHPSLQVGENALVYQPASPGYNPRAPNRANFDEDYFQYLMNYPAREEDELDLSSINENEPLYQLEGPRYCPRAPSKVDNTTRVDANANAQTKEVETTLVTEAKSSGDQTEPSNDQPENTLAEDATPDADDSTESSNSNDSGDEENNQLQMVIYQGVVESTPLAREDEEPSRQVEANDTPSSPTPNEKYYVSYDELLDSTSHNEFADFLHSISVPGLPPHKLILKKNCLVILLRNINPAEGLCNGIRLICDDFRDHVIRCVIASGEQFGKHVFISRIHLKPQRMKIAQSHLNATSSQSNIGPELTREDRKKLYSNFGLFCPYGHEELAIYEDIDQQRGPKELTGAVDLISQFKLLPYHEYFCKRQLPLSISDTHYLHNVVGDTEIRKGEGMQLDQLIEDASFSREMNASIKSFDLDVLGEAFQLRETSPIDLPSSEKGIPTMVGKSKNFAVENMKGILGIEHEEVQEEGEEIEEHEEEYIGDEREGDMVEEEVEDVNEDLESEEDDDHVGEEHGQMVDEAEEDEHDEVVKERRKRKELEIFIDVVS